MKQKGKRKITLQDIIRMNRKLSREEEIAQHGHPLLQHRVHVSKKVYNRKKIKAKIGIASVDETYINS
ncbi:hypothetical protein [uncultured Odoribacter sp.]|uniref:hypothetical protein n=1 Tax=uncultured Odoribacter sp. TaxID=876416 RepID=UPI002626E12E|nr:hypothetical protein [uncultured Odoribacter sp.]